MRADQSDRRVAPRALEPLQWLVERHGLELSAILDGLSLSPEAFRAPTERLSWFTFATIANRIAAQLGEEPERFREAGRASVGSPQLRAVQHLASFVASPQGLYAAAPKLGARALFPMVQAHFERVSDTRCRVISRLPPGYLPCRWIFDITAAHFEEMPRLMGLPPSTVVTSLEDGAWVATIDHARSRTLWSRLRRFARLVFNAPAALREVEERNAELSHQLQISDQAQARAERAVQSQQALLAAVSHELQSPLGVVVGLVDLARRSGVSEDADTHLMAATEEAGRLQHTLHVLVQVASLGRGIVEQDTTPVRLDVLVRRACAPYVGEPVALILEGLDEELPILHLPRDWVVEAVGELVANAFKYTSEGSVTVRVSATAVDGQQRHRVRIEVVDTGIGIPTDQLQDVFQPFVQVERGLSRGAGGIGLGLTLVQAIAGRLGGEVTLQSTVGKGTTVAIELVATEADEAFGDESALEEASDLSFHDEPPVLGAFADDPRPVDDSLAGLQVLVVDDHPINRLVLRKMLERYGASVDDVDSGVRALSHLAVVEALPDVVLMDVQMPGMDGLEATRRLRADDRFDAMAIVAVTAQVAPGDEAMCMAAGMDAYVPKPVEPERLRRGIAVGRVHAKVRAAEGEGTTRAVGEP